MANNAAETVIGAVVLAVAGGFLVYAANTADVSLSASGYELTAEFRKAEGLAIGNEVQISGVKIGSVRSIDLNPQSFYASVTISVQDSIRIPEDSIAKIVPESLLGGNLIAIDAGASEFMLEPGAAFEFTQGSVNLLDLVLRFGSGTDS